jgi:hypothetical protein
MEEEMEDKELYRRAESRVKAKMGFYTHLFIYAAVNTALFLVNGKNTGTYGFEWFTWPLVAWGVCVMFHFLSVFVFRGKLTERMIAKEMKRQAQGGR